MKYYESVGDRLANRKERERAYRVAQNYATNFLDIKRLQNKIISVL